MKIGILPISSMEKSPNCFPRHTLPRSSSRASAGKDLIWPRLQAFNSFWPWRFAMTTPQKKKLTWQRKSFIIQPLISNLCFQGGPSFCLVDFPCLPGTLKIFARHKHWKMSPEVSWQHGLENHLDKWAEGVGDGQLWLQIQKIASFFMGDDVVVPDFSSGNIWSWEFHVWNSLQVKRIHEIRLTGA